MAERIVVTGMGIVTGIGVGKESTLQSLLQGRSGVGTVKYLQTQHTEIPVCEVHLTEQEMRRQLDIPADAVTTRTPLLAAMALREALQQARLQPDGQRRVALVNGTTVGGMEKSEQLYLDFFDNKDVDYIAAHDCGAGTAFLAGKYGKFCQTTTISTACSSASNAIILGANLIKTGRADIAVVGGTECLSKFHLNGFNTLMILDRDRCRPFDNNRNGLNLGEGAAFLVIERESEAMARNVEILCTLEGYANSCDAFHQTATSPEGEGAYLAMTKALADSGLQPSDIDYINAHGTGTPNNDSSEGTAILRVFGNNYPPVSSTKAFTGHCTSAAGSVEAVISILAMQNGFIPPNLGFETPMDDVAVVPQKSLAKDVALNHVMTNSFGFGGNDSSVIFGKYRPEVSVVSDTYNEGRGVFIGGASQISVQQPLSEEWFENPVFYNEKYIRALAPDYKQFIDPKAARRMGAVLKRALTTALSALKNRDISDLQAIITGTGLGCIENTEKFLRAMVVDGEQLLTPTYFMQSTHNTISSQVALNLHCHGYNCTYSQRGVSFESALQDAFLQFKLGKIGNALVGGHDEMTPDYYDLLDKVRFWDGTFAGETALTLFLENKRKADTWCELLDIQLLFHPAKDELQTAVDAMLQRHGLVRGHISAVMTGRNDNAQNNAPYDIVNEMFPSASELRFKHLFGDGFTMSAMGIYAAAVCLKNGKIPSFLTNNNAKNIEKPRNILVVNHYKDLEYSLSLLSNV